MLWLLVYAIEVSLLFEIERKLWGTIFTPLNMLMLPYSLATLIAIIYTQYDINTPCFYYPSLLVWIVGLLLFAIPSIILGVYEKRCGLGVLPIVVGDKDDHYDFLRDISFFCILFSLTKLHSMSADLDTFGTDAFSEQYQSSSILNHLSVLLGVIFSYSIYKADRQHKSSFLIIIGSLIGMYAVGTKSWIIAPFLIGFLARLITKKTVLTIKTILFPVVIIFIIFFVSYYISLVLVAGDDASNEFYLFVVTHFVDYFSGATLALGLDFKQGFVEPDMTSALFAPLLNIINVLIKEPYVEVINPTYMDLGTLGDNNVRTFFGTIFAYSKSYLFFIMVPFIFSSFIYSVYYSSRRSNSIFMLLANCTNMCFLVFGFFEYYWLNLSCYEYFAILICMHYIFNRKRQIINY